MLALIGNDQQVIFINRDEMEMFYPIERSLGFDTKKVEKASLVTKSEWGDLFHLQYHLQ